MVRKLRAMIPNQNVLRGLWSLLKIQNFNRNFKKKKQNGFDFLLPVSWNDNCDEQIDGQTLRQTDEIENCFSFTHRHWCHIEGGAIVFIAAASAASIATADVGHSRLLQHQGNGRQVQQEHLIWPHAYNALAFLYYLSRFSSSAGHAHRRPSVRPTGEHSAT